MAKVNTKCKFCNSSAKRVSLELGYPGVCKKHLRFEIAKEVKNES